MNIAILGAGLMGQVLALTLLRRDAFDVTLYDDGGPSTALSAAGMIAPFTELDRAEWSIAQLGQQSLKLWPQLLTLLPERVYFQQQGALVCAHAADRPEWLHYYRRVHRYAQHIDCHTLTAEELQVLEPDLQDFSEAYYFPQEGQIDCQKFVNVAHDFLSGHIRAASDFAATDTDYVIDCRGLGAKRNFADLRGVRGEVVWLQTDALQLQRPVRLLHPRYSIYIVPRPDNVYIIGASEIEAEDNSAISVRSLLELLSAACSVHKAFLEARVIHTTSRCRPTLRHHLPQVKYQSGRLAINGLYRHGCALAPTLAHEVANYLEHGISELQYPQLWEQADVDLS